MRLSLAIPLILTSTLASCQLVIPPALAGSGQIPLHDMADKAPRTSSSERSLADCLTVERSLSLFYEYAREVPTVMSRLTSSAQRTTVLAPSDRAIIALPRKPHQDRVDMPRIEELAPQAADERTASNVESFISAHVLATHPVSPPPLGTPLKTLLDDHTITFRADASAGAGLRVDPGDVEVLRIEEVANGRVYYLGGIVGY